MTALLKTAGAYHNHRGAPIPSGSRPTRDAYLQKNSMQTLAAHQLRHFRRIWTIDYALLGHQEVD